MTIKSASEQIHGVLARENRGFRFTAAQLSQICKIAGIDVTYGAVTGFIFRAQQKKMVSAEALRKSNGRGKAHKAAVYMLLDPTIAWDFACPSEGRVAGSINLSTKPSLQSSLPFLQDLLEETGMSGLQDGKIISFVPSTGNAMGDNFIAQTQASDMYNIEPKKEVSILKNGLADQLLELATKVAKLENRPVKTLTDYTSAELIAELAKRLGALDASPE
jgi:hypothetical protein